LKLDKEQIQEDEKNRMSDPTDPKNLPKLASLWLQIAVSSLTKIVSEETTPLIYDNTELLKDFLNRYKTFELGHLKHDLMDFYGILQFQTKISECVRVLLRKDEHFLYREFLTKKRKGIKQESKLCFGCSTDLHNLDNEEKNKCVLFGCGHMYHVSCIGEITRCPTCYQNTVTSSEEPTQQETEKREVEFMIKPILRKYHLLEKNLKTNASMKLVKEQIGEPMTITERQALT
jgi:hypothetical protein